MTTIKRVSKDVFDFYYEPSSTSHGRFYLDGAWGSYGFEVWAGRRHLIVEFPALARCLRAVWEAPGKALDVLR